MSSSSHAPAVVGIESRRRQCGCRVAVASLLAGLALSVLSAAAIAGDGSGDSDGSNGVERLQVKVVATYPHDPDAYTQGLLFYDGSLYESTGRYGKSSLRRIDLASGNITALQPLPPEYFGEGLALAGERLVQLTWQEGLALFFRLDDLAEEGERSFTGEGWGLCFDGESLVMSDGTHVLSFRDPETFDETRRVRVTKHGSPLDRLNELEYVDGAIYANVYQTDEIVRIDPASGEVRAVIDASNLLSPAERRTSEVLNGIAYRQTTGTFLLTGKLWPKLFEVVFEPRP